jgi:V8-like Glu-specific endopeptidase
MATPKAKDSDGHTSIASEPEAATRPTKPTAKPPSEGTNPKTPKANADGTEAVTGYKLRTEAEAAEDAAVFGLDDLRDIGEASFGPPPPGLETVIGHDDRVQITNTAIYPWRVNCSLLITARDNSMWIGTGWFNGPHTVITAGHCVFIKGSGVPGRDGWVKSIRVMPGRNGNSLPYGAVTSSNFRSVLGWTRDGDQNYDYGAIILSTNLGNTTGWFGFGVYSDSDLTSSTGNLSGYPGDKPGGTQWYHARRIVSVGARKVYYDIDTFGGQSGSAVYRIISGGRYAVAIHAYGVGGGVTLNSGTRITKPVFDNLLAWKA